MRFDESRKPNRSEGVSYLAWEHALADSDKSPWYAWEDEIGEGYLGCIAIVYGSGQIVTLAIWLTLTLESHATFLGIVFLWSFSVATKCNC